MCDRCDRGVGYDQLSMRAESERWIAETQRRVDSGGWMIEAVEGGFVTPSFAYTVGLTSLRHPELLVFGLDPGQSAEVLNFLGDEVRAGRAMQDGDLVRLSEQPAAEVRLFDLPNPRRVLLGAGNFYRGARRRSFRALQAVYPDRAGVFPWEPGCHLKLGSQPMPGQFVA